MMASHDPMSHGLNHSVLAEARRVRAAAQLKAVTGLKAESQVLGDLQVLMRDLDQPRSGEGSPSSYEQSGG